MRIKKYLVIIILLISASLGMSNEKVLDARLLSSVNKLVAGNENRIAVEITIHSPWHINGHEPLDEFLIPTTVTFDSLESISISNINYPFADEKIFEFSEEPVAVYEETVYVYATLHLPQDVAGKTIKLTGKVDYQACNDQFCLAPASADFSVEWPVADGSEGVEKINTGIFGTVKN